MVFDKVMQSHEAYQLSVRGDITSFETALTQDIRIMCAQITEPFYRVCLDVLDSVDGLPLQ